MPPTITFSHLQREHVPLLHSWLQQKHVREFWDDGHRTLEQVAAYYLPSAENADTAAYIILLDGQSAGYIQAYQVTPEHEYAQWRAQRGATLGIDIFIGALEWLGQGHAPAIIQAFIQHLQRKEPQLARLLIDPEKRNARARHVYAKVGFQEVGQVQGQLILALNVAGAPHLL